MHSIFYSSKYVSQLISKNGSQDVFQKMHSKHPPKKCTDNTHPKNALQISTLKMLSSFPFSSALRSVFKVWASSAWERVRTDCFNPKRHIVRQKFLYNARDQRLNMNVYTFFEPFRNKKKVFKTKVCLLRMKFEGPRFYLIKNEFFGIYHTRVWVF